MSAHQQPQPTTEIETDDAWPDRDAYAIDIPESFVEAYPEADSVLDALAMAEQAAPTTADDEDQPTCPRCGGRRLLPKAGQEQANTKTDGYQCGSCGTHVSDPEHPALADIAFSDGQTQLGRFGDE